VERYKARYVAKGFSQRPGQDFDETFSPVPRAETIRTVLALAVEQGLELDYADFETAFLNSKLNDHEVYMKQPHGFDDHSGRVCLLSKAIYGLKQASREWNKEVTSMFSTLQYQQCKSDPCVYVKRQEKNLCIGVLWVDDLITAANDKRMRQDLIAGLSSRYKLKDKGELTWFLKLRVVYSKEAGVLTIDQGKYLSELMERFNMKSCGPKSTPQAPGVILTKQDAPRTLEENAKMSHTPYKEAVGCLLYSSYWTRPDTANATRDVSRMMACAGEAHWQAVKHILRYIQGTQAKGIKYKRTGQGLAIIGYTDASWASDQDDRKSTSGYIFLMAGGPISWSSKRQQTVALSSCEAEYLALGAAAQEAMFLRHLVTELTGEEQGPTTILVDNQSAISMADNPSHHSRAKHLAVREHFIRECISSKQINLKWCPTADMVADLLTKPVTAPVFKRLAASLVCDV
jgi:hypothetical protein